MTIRSEVIRYNNTWLSFILLAACVNITNAFLRLTILAIISFTFIMCAVITCLCNIGKGKAANFTIQSRPNSFFALAENVFNKTAICGITAYFISGIVFLFAFNLYFSIFRSLLLVVTAVFIYMWNTGWIKHIKKPLTLPKL